MTIQRAKDWEAGEILKAGDLNAEFNNIINNLTPTNISKVTNDVLRNLVSSFTNDDVDIYEIQKEIDIIDDQLLKLQSRKTELVTQVTSFEEKKRKNQQKNLTESVKMAETIKRSGIL